MTSKKRPAMIDGKPWYESAGLRGAFARHTGHDGEECLIYVSWSGLGDRNDNGDGHRLLRARVSADLGVDVPDPAFTNDEMQEIMRATKLAALKCLRARAKRKT